MKSIDNYTEEEYQVMSECLTKLREAVNGTSSRDWFENYTKCSRYGHYKFSGDITNKLVEMLGHEPTPDEIIMLANDGFNHFGAGCIICDRHFDGAVLTD